MALAILLLGSTAFAQIVPAPAFPQGGFGPSIQIPTFDIGDWNSSGDVSMAPSLLAKLDVSYSCQAQLTDQVPRKDRQGLEFTRYEIAEFKFTKDQLFVSAADLKWFPKAFYSNYRILDLPGPASYKTASTWIALSAKDERTASLRMNVRQFLNQDIYVDGTETFLVPLGWDSFERTVSAPVGNSKDQNYPRMSLRVVCHNLK